MPIAALGLILLSAVVHVLTHLAFKRARRRLAFVWWFLLVAQIIFLPLAGDLRQFPPVLWLILIFSGAFDAMYFGAIGRAYAEADLWGVYPLARGSAREISVIFGVFAGAQLLGEGRLKARLLGAACVVAGVALISFLG